MAMDNIIEIDCVIFITKDLVHGSQLKERLLEYLRLRKYSKATVLMITGTHGKKDGQSALSDSKELEEKFYKMDLKMFEELRQDVQFRGVKFEQPVNMKDYATDKQDTIWWKCISFLWKIVMLFGNYNISYPSYEQQFEQNKKRLVEKVRSVQPSIVLLVVQLQKWRCFQCSDWIWYLLTDEDRR